MTSHDHDYCVSLCTWCTEDHTTPNWQSEWVCTRRLCSCEVQIICGVTQCVRRTRTPHKCICSWATVFPICLQWRQQDKVRCLFFLQTQIILENSVVFLQPSSACLTLKFSGSTKLLPFCHVSNHEQTVPVANILSLCFLCGLFCISSINPPICSCLFLSSWVSYMFGMHTNLTVLSKEILA